MLVVSCLGIFYVVNATDNPGEIKISKSATKKFDDDLNKQQDNLIFGREAEVTLDVSAVPYKNKPFTTMDVILVIDESGSMKNNDSSCKTYYTYNSSSCKTYYSKLESAQIAAKNFVDKVLVDNNPNIRVGVVKFASEVHGKLNLTSNKTTVKNYFNGLSADGGTNISSALNTAYDMISKSSADQRLVVLLSDGEPTFFTYNNKIFGGGSDGSSNVNTKYSCSSPSRVKDELGYNYDLSDTTYDWYECSGKNDLSTTPASETKKSALPITALSDLTFYTVGFKVNNTTQSLLTEISSNKSNFLKAESGDELKNKFDEVFNKTVETISKDTVVTDTPQYFARSFIVIIKIPPLNKFFNCV